MKRTFTLVYASQTGQSKAIAEQIYDLASKNGFESNLYSIDDFYTQFKFNEIKVPVVFVISTTGDGEVPETAVKCYHKLKSKDVPEHFLNFNYALLGLGDSNYAQFCNGPKLFHKIFQQLGAKCFYGPSWADDGTGLEVEVEPFIEGLWSALDKQIKQMNEVVDHLSNQLAATDLNLKSDVKDFETPLSGIELTVPQLSDQHLFIEYLNESQTTTTTRTDGATDANNNNQEEEQFLKHYHQNNLYQAKVVDKKVLTATDAVKTCISLSFVSVPVPVDSAKEPFQYEPGHSIDVVCPNDDREIEMLFKRLNIKNGHEPIKFKISNSKKAGANLAKLTDDLSYVSLYFVFKYCIDIRNGSLKKALLRMLAEWCDNEKEKRRLLELCSKEGTQQYQELIKANAFSLVDLLNTFQSCKPPIDLLVQMLSSLQSRAYSLCTCTSDSSMEIMFNMVQFDSMESRTYERLGVGTGYLSKLNKNDKFYFIKRTHQNFVLPETCNQSPLIMIGPGTGLAPYLSFLKYKKVNLDKFKQDDKYPDWWLLYGCRDPTKDFLYKSELCDDYAKDPNLLTKFRVAYSRYSSTTKESEYHEASTKYVQDIIKKNSKDLVDLIVNKNAYFYVCGDARNMAKDVFSCLVNCIESECKETIKDANKYIFEMMSAKRYRQDIWN